MPPRSENFAAAFAKGGDWEEHVGGVFVPSPLLYYYTSIFSAIVKCHSLVVTIFTNIYRFRRYSRDCEMASSLLEYACTVSAWVGFPVIIFETLRSFW
jgi:hypothetical protein